MPALLVFAVIAGALLVNLAAQAACHRFFLPNRLVASLLIGCAAGLAAAVAGLALAFAYNGSTSVVDVASAGASAGIIYLANSFTFICLVAAGETSVRFQILRVLGEGRDGLTLAELDARYSNATVIQTRLDRLQRSGVVALSEGRYYGRSVPLLIVALLFRRCRILIYGRASEFDRSRPMAN